MTPKEKCGRCGKELEPNTPEEEAEAQAAYEKFFPNSIKMQEPRVPVCEECYELCRPDKWPEQLAAAETFTELN